MTLAAAIVRRALLPSLLLLLMGGLCVMVPLGCAARFDVRRVPPGGFDAAIVLGCPNEPDGRLSRCQWSRAAWAAELWRMGAVRHFITSGGAVHSPWVEAESLAQAMTALGVPSDRIYLETDALHTDENVHNSMRIAEALGLRTLGVVSNGGHASFACEMMTSWGHPCVALGVDNSALKAAQPRLDPLLAAERYPRVSDGQYLAIEEREQRRAAVRGTRRRPPSFLLYPYMVLLRVFGEPWVPSSPRTVPTVTWAERCASRQASPAASPPARTSSAPSRITPVAATTVITP